MKKCNILFILLFILCLTLPLTVWTGLRIFAPERFEELNGGLEEKRELSSVEWDRLWSDCSSIGSAFDDRGPFRDLIISRYQKTSGKAERDFDKSILTPLMQQVMNKPKRTGDDKPAKPEKKSVPAGTLPHVGPVLPDIPETEGSSGETAAPTEPESTGCPHAYEETVLCQADCENAGEARYVCRLCGEDYTAVLPALGHDKLQIGSSQADYENWGYTDYQCSRCGVIFRENVTEPWIDDSYLAPRIVGNGAVPGKYDWLFYAYDGSVDYYKGTNLLPEAELAAYAEKLNTLQALCKAKDIRLVIQFLPNKEQVYSRYVPSYGVQTDYKRTARLADYLREHTEVPIFYPLEEMKAADLYHRTYYKYDTHWSMYGAYVGTMELLRLLDIPGEDPYDLRRTGEYKGDEYIDLMSLGGLWDSGRPWLQEFFPDCLAGVNITKEEYSSNKNILRSESDNENGLKMAYFGDSFRIMQEKYLSKSFAKCLIAHRDYLSTYMKQEILDCDVLILSAVERNDIRVFTSADRLIALLSQ